MADALRDVHVVVVPSIWEETAGLAAIEQMMRGGLVIVSYIAAESRTGRFLWPESPRTHTASRHARPND